MISEFLPCRKGLKGLGMCSVHALYDKCLSYIALTYLGMYSTNQRDCSITRT